eukprot:2547013-Prymnesium_polylepis.1
MRQPAGSAVAGGHPPDRQRRWCGGRLGSEWRRRRTAPAVAASATRDAGCGAQGATAGGAPGRTAGGRAEGGGSTVAQRGAQGGGSVVPLSRRASPHSSARGAKGESGGGAEGSATAAGSPTDGRKGGANRLVSRVAGHAPTSRREQPRAAERRGSIDGSIGCHGPREQRASGGRARRATVVAPPRTRRRAVVAPPRARRRAVECSRNVGHRRAVRRGCARVPDR